MEPGGPTSKLKKTKVKQRTKANKKEEEEFEEREEEGIYMGGAGARPKTIKKKKEEFGEKEKEEGIYMRRTRRIPKTIKIKESVEEIAFTPSVEEIASTSQAIAESINNLSLKFLSIWFMQKGGKNNTIVSGTSILMTYVMYCLQDDYAHYEFMRKYITNAYFEDMRDFLDEFVNMQTSDLSEEGAKQVIKNYAVFIQDRNGKDSPDVERFKNKLKAFADTTVLESPREYLKLKRVTNRMDDDVKVATENIIRALVTVKELNSSDDLSLINLTFFKGPWQCDFNLEPKLYIFNGERVQKNIQYMSTIHVLQYGYSKHLNAFCVKVPFKSLEGIEGSNYEALILLSAIDQENGNYLPRIELLMNEMEGDPQCMDTFDFNPKRVKLNVPLFEATDVISASDIFQRLDIDITSNMIQASALKVTEKGTVGSARTTIFHDGPTVWEKQVNVNRPFLFIVRNKSNGLHLFSSVIVDASEGQQFLRK